MKKKYILLFIFACIISAVSMFGLGVNAENESSTQTIETFSGIGETGNYIFSESVNEIEFPSDSIESFKGRLNGNSIVVKGGDTFVSKPLFTSISDGAVVEALVFDHVIFKSDTDLNQTSFGLIAFSANNVTVRNIRFVNCQFLLVDKIELADFNCGLLFGKATNCTISSILIENCEMSSDKTTDDYLEIASNSNIGYLVGYADYNTKINNCKIDCTVNKVEKDNGTETEIIDKKVIDIYANSQTASNFNFGGLVGASGEITVCNNIVNIFSAGIETNTPKLEVKGSFRVNIGGLIGKTNNVKTNIYNNVANTDFELVTSCNDYVGSLIGFLTYSNTGNTINGFISTSDKYFGNQDEADFIYDFSELHFYAYQLSELYKSSTYNSSKWVQKYAWNLNNIWSSKGNTDLPNLQAFQTFEIHFSQANSLKTLELETLPTGNIIAFDIKYDNGASIVDSKYEYGKDLSIQATITTDNNMSNFFYVTGLQLEEKTIFENKTYLDIVENGIPLPTDTPTEYSLDGKTVYVTKDGNVIRYSSNFNDIDLIEDEGKISYVIKNCSEVNAGTYSVKLSKYTYKLKIEVQSITENNVEIIPGKIKDSMATTAQDLIEVDVQYGFQKKYLAIPESDYSQEVDWQIYYGVDAGSCAVSLSSLSKLDIKFNENCELFGEHKDTFDLSEFKKTEDTQQVFYVKLVFNKDIQLVVIKLYDGDKVITDNVATISLDDEVLTFSNGCYSKKIRFGSGDHILKVTSHSTQYSFDGWYYLETMSKLATVDNFDNAASFSIVKPVNIEELDDMLEISAKFINNDKVGGRNLLWLWIVLSIAGIGGIIALVVVLVIKKRKHTSYKSHFYY